jgi:hypothetical protein
METETTTLLAGAAVALGALGLLLALFALRRAGAAKRALGELMSEGEAASGGRQMAKALAGVADHAARLAVSEGRLTELEAAAGRAVSRVGHVQFQAYEDAGVGQSSSLALLDDGGSGVVITTLHARVGTRIYVKRVMNGTSETTLGEEERAAIEAAIAQPGGTRRRR